RRGRQPIVRHHPDLPERRRRAAHRAVRPADGLAAIRGRNLARNRRRRRRQSHADHLSAIPRVIDMRRLLPMRLEIWGLLLLGFAGCGPQGEKTDLEYTAVLEVAEEKFFVLTAVLKDTPVTVAADSGRIKIELYIFKAQSEEEATSMLRKQNPN